MMPHFTLPLDDAIKTMADETAGTVLTADHVPEHYGSWSTNVRSWTQTPNPQLLVLRYEDMLAKPRASFKRVTNFLGLKHSPERLERAIRFSSYRVLKAQEQKTGFKERTNESNAFFRDGKPEQWHENMTPVQVRRIITAQGTPQ